MAVNLTLSGYADALFGGEDSLLQSMHETAQQEGLPAIQVPPELGRLLQFLIVHSRVRDVLEIGTLYGYSAILMARVLPPGGRITTLEYNPKHAAIARQNVQRAGFLDQVDVKEGAALDLIEGMNEHRFDLIFIDADKESYPAYLDRSIHLTHPGSLIVADNLWRNGSVLDPGDPQSEAIARFNRKLVDTPQLRTILVPTRDGADAASVSTVVSVT